MAGISKEDLLEEIRPGMRLTWAFFKKIYGYSITDPAFPDRALDALKAAGCCHAREYYDTWLQRYQEEHDAMMKNVAAWLREGKDGWLKESRRRPGNVRDEVKRLDPEELAELCRRLLQEGAISDPEELVTFITDR